MSLAPLAKRSTARLVAKIETHRRKIAQHRDRLWELREELQQRCEDCTDADEHLEAAIAALQDL